MKRLILFLLLFGTSACLLAQTSGYIRKGSSYKSGYVYPQSAVRSFNTCKFSLTKTSEVITYTPDQILAYGYGKYTYVSLKIKSGNDSVNMFFEAIVQGDNPVYFLNETSGKHFYIVNTKKELVELVKKDGEYKHQLAAYYSSPTTIVPGIHAFFNKQGIIKTVKILKESTLANIYNATEAIPPEQKHLSIKQKKWLLMKKPVASVSLQSGVTFQRLPLDLQAGLPEDWNAFKASSLTYSLAVDLPIIKFWPVTYHQEIYFNKFVTDYRQGSDPPEYQLIQDFSVISLPAMLRYTVGRKKITGFFNAGFQLDIVLNKDNVGWLKLVSNNNSVYEAMAIEYRSYSKFQPGITAGFGITYKLNKKFAVNSEFRFCSLFNVLPDKSGAESQITLKAGITYTIFKKGK
ncbi:MAG: outer membrane beta-barrel protein [Bacteroidales bacterium]|nr:outer membrane beta-barrel protein [Bacteroidales bacterium]